MADRAAIRVRLLQTFRAEADEHLGAIRGVLAALETGGPEDRRPAELDTAFRIVHTLKGAARSVGLLPVEARCQHAESLLSDLSRGRATLDAAALDALKTAMDETARLIGDMAETPPEPAGARRDEAGPAAATVTGGGRSVRIATDELDALLHRAEALIGPRLAAEARAAEAAAVLRTALACHSSVVLERQLRTLLSHLTADRWATTETVDSLLADVRTLRMSPATFVLDVLPGMVADLARQQGKNVRLEIRGGDLRVDRRILETIKDPLIHLARNAIDHGVEAPEARRQAGKPPAGRLTISVEPADGGRVSIRVEDDGAGIDVDKVRHAAVRSRALAAADARAMPDDAALELVYRSGISTNPIVTAISGHGLGLAIVKERVESLGGLLRIENRPGAGSTFQILAPAAVSTLRGLVVGAGDARYLLPLDAVEAVGRAPAGATRLVEGRAMLEWNGAMLPLATLADLLGVETSARHDAPPHVIVGSAAGRVALAVDEVLGVHEAMDKPFGPPLRRVRDVAGAALLGTGDVVLLLRPADLVRHARARPRDRAAAATRPVTRRLKVLVVDDSITTRVMEKSLLEAAGYDVHAAVDGVDAWTVLRSEPIDLVVSDVDMPRMDGFELTRRLRADERLHGLPVILVTALESREDKERGVDAGANAYVVKSGFDQSHLLDIVRRLA